MRYEKTLKVDGALLAHIQHLLTDEPTSASDCFGENSTITQTVAFSHGIEMDIKCCGVQYEEGSSNTAWTEAVLFHNGSQVAFSEPSDAFDGEWELEYNGDTYVANVVSNNTVKSN